MSGVIENYPIEEKVILYRFHETDDNQVTTHLPQIDLFAPFHQ